MQELHLFVVDHKKVPFDFPSLCVSCRSVREHQGCKCLTWRCFLIFPPREVPLHQEWGPPPPLFFFSSPSATTPGCFSWWPSGGGGRASCITCQRARYFPSAWLLLFLSLLHFSLPLSLSFSYSPSFSLSFTLPPHLGPAVIGIPSGSWDPYKHSRQRERARARQSVCEEEKDMQAERKRKPASQYAGSLEHWVTVAAASFVCVCPILCLKQNPPPLSAHTGKPDSNTPRAAWSPVIWAFRCLWVFGHSGLWNNYQINSSELSKARPFLVILSSRRGQGCSEAIKAGGSDAVSVCCVLFNNHAVIELCLA